MISISRTGSMRSPVVVVGHFAFKFAQNARGRASNLYEAKLYRSANATRRVLLCPVLWISRNGFVQIMRAAKPLTDMMSLDEYMQGQNAGRGQLSLRTEGVRLGMVRRPDGCARLLDPGVGGRRTYFRFSPLNELYRCSPSVVISL